MSAVLCPDCGNVMIWIRGQWRCLCRAEFVEEREAARLDLLAVVRLPEEVPADGSVKVDVAERLLVERGLRFVEKDGNRWIYGIAGHILAAWVTIENTDRSDGTDGEG